MLLYTSWGCLESLRSLSYSTVDPRYDLRPRFFSSTCPHHRISAGMASSAHNRPTWLIHTCPSHQIRRTSPKSQWQSEQKRYSGAPEHPRPRGAHPTAPQPQGKSCSHTPQAGASRPLLPSRSPRSRLANAEGRLAARATLGPRRDVTPLTTRRRRRRWPRRRAHIPAPRCSAQAAARDAPHRAACLALQRRRRVASCYGRRRGLEPVGRCMMLPGCMMLRSPTDNSRSRRTNTLPRSDFSRDAIAPNTTEAAAHPIKPAAPKACSSASAETCDRERGSRRGTGKVSEALQLWAKRVQSSMLGAGST